MVYKGKDHTNYWTRRQKQTMENVLYNYLAHSFSDKGSKLFTTFYMCQIIQTALQIPTSV